MKNLLCIFLFTGAALAVSCGKDTIDGGSGEVPIAFIASGDGVSFGVESKVSEVTSLSSFNVAAINDSYLVDESCDDYGYLWQDTFSGGPLFTASGRFWPAGNVNFNAFFASNLPIHGGNDNTYVEVDCTVDAVAAVTLSAITPRAVNNLTFNHILARTGVCTVTNGSGAEISDLLVTFSPFTHGYYECKFGFDDFGWTPSAPDEPQTITIASAVGENAATDRYFIPGSYVIRAMWKETRGEYVAEHDIVSSPKYFSAGKINNVNVTISTSTAVPITFGISVSPWTVGTTIDASF